MKVSIDDVCINCGKYITNEHSVPYVNYDYERRCDDEVKEVYHVYWHLDCGAKPLAEVPYEIN